MFIYFPEYLVKHFNFYIKSNFNLKIQKENCIDMVKAKLDSPQSEYFQNYIKEFREKRINLPIVEFKHCLSFFTNNLSKDPSRISKYDHIENKIIICKNLIFDYDELSMILDKELSYAKDFNFLIKVPLSLEDYSKFAINACKAMLTNTKSSANNTLKNEQIRRCSYLEFKYKFNKEIRQSYIDNSHLDLELDLNELKFNEIVKKIIDQNFI
jgi:hypothetical protein